MQTQNCVAVLDLALLLSLWLALFHAEIVWWSLRVALVEEPFKRCVWKVEDDCVVKAVQGPKSVHSTVASIAKDLGHPCRMRPNL